MTKGGSGGRTPTGPAAAASDAGRAGVRLGPGAVKYGRALARLEGDGRAATRGANETRVYQAASVAVVLIVSKEAVGSGVLVSTDGKIVTNLHVVGDNATVGVIFKPMTEGAEVTDADVHRAKVLRRDEVSDLALIQVTELPAHAKPLAIGSASTVQVGADVHAIGHPTGQAWTYTRGIVSQIRRDYAWENQGEHIAHQALVIQTQTPINPGNSGGPLINDRLEVIGINSFKGEGEGLNFAVSADDVRAFLARTEDRKAERTGGRGASKASAENCKATELDSRPSEDPVGVEYLMDVDCDGEGDFELVIPKSKREPITMLFDDDGDGKIDHVEYDQNHDFRPELAFYDTDGNGKIDMRGFYRKGEDEPYRWEKLKEE